MNPIFVLIISVLLALFFVFAGSIKIFGWQRFIFETQLAFFNKYGLNRTIMALIGLIELFGAIFLWLPGYLGIAGSLALLGTSVGAICFHFYFDTWKDAIPAIITMSFSGILVYAQVGALAI